MSTSMRRIAIYVNEAGDGGYRWMLIERGPKSTHWTEIQAAEEPVETYREAMAAGLVALQAMIADLDVGPREAAAPEPASKPRGSHFGFGDLPG
jgi:hypothetical protein